MDSVTQAALGAAVSVALMGRKVPWLQAATVGALAGTLPDLDVLIDHGDDLMNMVRHRAESHSLYYLALASPALGWVTAWLLGKIQRQPAQWSWQWSAVWLFALITHVLIDWMTVYGTQLLQPWSDWAYAVGSIFIIDPLYTAPLLLGLLLSALQRGRRRALLWNGLGLGLSTVYMFWTAWAQAHVADIAKTAFQNQGRHAHHWVVTPTPLNTVLWRVVAVSPTHSYEGFYSLLDQDREIEFTQHVRGEQWLSRWADVPHVHALTRFTQGAVRMEMVDGQVLMTDLRMGQEPNYSFVFQLGTPAQLDSGQVSPQSVRMPLDARAYLNWVWERAKGKTLLSE